MKRVGHDVAPTWRSVASNFDLTAGLAHLAHSSGRCSFWNDLSLLQIEARPTEVGHTDFNCDKSLADLAMCRAHVGMYAILKSPLIISMWLPSLSAAARGVLTNTNIIDISQDPLGIQARRVKSVTPANATMSSPRDVSAVLAHCNSSKPTQRWRMDTAFAVNPTPMLVTQECNSSAQRQHFDLTSEG